MSYYKNIKELTKENKDFRHVVYTGKYAQLVIMSLEPGIEIGEEVHDSVDQFFYFIKGRGEAIINGESQPLEKGYTIFVPAGTRHNIKNISETDDLKLFTIYSPPNHPDGMIAKTKKDAQEYH